MIVLETNLSFKALSSSLFTAAANVSIYQYKNFASFTFLIENSKKRSGGRRPLFLFIFHIFIHTFLQPLSYNTFIRQLGPATFCLFFIYSYIHSFNHIHKYIYPATWAGNFGRRLRPVTSAGDFGRRLRPATSAGDFGRRLRPATSAGDFGR